ncbi:hypothetical protein [Noviherbaspirillum sp. ST9]|uniref:hypothetical protein n=1 Tax=Noviherbaspirillum sp. ST9 TaxID=3401606 RepID=UPI003B589723
MRAALIGFWFMVTGVQAASLQFCPDTQGAGGTGAQVVRADGAQMRLVVGEAMQSGCHGIVLPLPADVIAAVHPVGAAPSPGERILLQGPEREGRFIIGSVSTTGGQPAVERPQPMPLLENLLPALTVRVFGVEERVQARIADGRLRLDCRAGSRPAGVLLSGKGYLPMARSTLRVQGNASGRFNFAVADTAQAAKESAVGLGSLDPGKESLNLELPRAGFDRTRWHSFSIACPREAAELDLADLRLVPQSSSPATRSAWMWDAQQWVGRPGDVVARAQARGVRTLFVSIPVSGHAVLEPQRLVTFVRLARAAGIAVWSVDGDPRMVLPGEHAKTVMRARAYAAYNAGVDADARLAGMQFDIEHYLLPGYELSASALDKHYLSLARALRSAAQGMPLEFVVPFWWAEKTELMKGLAAAASGLNVMDYRTDPEQIRRFAVPFLDWGAMHGKSVRIALEAGPVEPEQQRRYVRATEGELWLVNVEQTPVLVLLKEARANPHGPAFRLESASVFDGSATSFHRDPERLVALLPELEAWFSAWTSFGGIALHELK